MKCACKGRKPDINKTNTLISFIEASRPYIECDLKKAYVTCPWCGKSFGLAQGDKIATVKDYLYVQ